MVQLTMFIYIHLFVAGLNKMKHKSSVHDGQQIIEEKREAGVEPLHHLRVLERRKRKPGSRWRTQCVCKQTRGRRAGGWAGLSVIVCHHLLEAGDYITSDCADQGSHVIHEALGETILPRRVQFVSKIQMMHHALHLWGYKLQHSRSQLLLALSESRGWETSGRCLLTISSKKNQACCRAASRTLPLHTTHCRASSSWKSYRVKPESAPASRAAPNTAPMRNVSTVHGKCGKRWVKQTK